MIKEHKPKRPMMLGDDSQPNAETNPLIFPYSFFDKDSDGLLKTKTFPLLPVRNTVLFPGMNMPIMVSREVSARLLAKMEKSGGTFVVSTQKDSSIEIPTLEGLCNVGTLAKVDKFEDLPNGKKSVILIGIGRVKIEKMVSGKQYLFADVTPLLEEPLTSTERKSLDIWCCIVKDAIVSAVNDKESLGHLLTEAAKANGSKLINFFAGITNILLHQKIQILEENSPLERARILHVALNDLVSRLELRRDICNMTSQRLSEQQREYQLRQELRTIEMELGEDSKNNEVGEYEKRSRGKKWSAATREVFQEELGKLSRMDDSSSGYSVQVQYIETFLSLPWREYSKDKFSIEKAEKRLNADHFGLDDVKERILEHLAVLKLKGDMKSPILCLYGPPGVGKTSLGKSIASALGRKFVRMSLGGVHDESEIRGHRRTYVGAAMGRILQGIKQAGTSNPVFLLDEIDKLSASLDGAPEAALLEVLDPEQNTSFYDNYLGADYDLSKVMFIATANNIGDVSRPLLDRMELIDVSGYAVEEKVEIAIRHLLPREQEIHGMAKKSFGISRSVMTFLVERYTRESGVRQLEKTLASICRKIALKIAKGESVPRSLKEKDIVDLLGFEKYNHDVWEDDMGAGVVTGLAWTQVGGEILFIETSASKGKGKLNLTGNLGDVMKESAILAIEYVKANASTFGLDGMDFDEMNFHIHVPEGAVPKDGPSAGITMVTSVVSALTGKKVRKRVAMTGEITLRGNVLPVGGIKEKILAAKRAGIREVILSDANRKDIEEINKEYIKGLTFHHVKTIKEVIDNALE